MKKLSIILTSLAGLLGIGYQAGATSTAFTIPSAGDLVGYVIDFGQPFLSAFWPIIGALVGIGLVFFIIGKITNRF